MDKRGFLIEKQRYSQITQTVSVMASDNCHPDRIFEASKRQRSGHGYQVFSRLDGWKWEVHSEEPCVAVRE